MKNFLAKIVYQIVGAENSAVEQFDEQLCLIEARDTHEAFFKARMLGVKNEDEVVTDMGHGLFWKFVDVPYLKELKSMLDGEELYSCVSERDQSDHYASFIKKRAQEIQERVEQSVIAA
ncbi:MAG: DUF4288 domain-containing protein [bacterium]|nr:DUF4288 domain-containing protein [bacterium]